MDLTSITITQHIYQMQKRFPEASGELSSLLSHVALAGKIISREVNKAGLVEILGLTGEINVQGEHVQKLDEFANRVMIHTLTHSGDVCIMASEENETFIEVEKGHRVGSYTIAFDPLDGSNNIDANVSVGTIFSIHRRRTKRGKGVPRDILQPGNEQVAAGYIVYGSSTMMVLATRAGVDGFTLDPSVGEFLRSHRNIRCPHRGNTYSVNEGNFPYWDLPMQNYVRYIKEMDKRTFRPYTARYIGSLVADAHRTLLNGGIFMYPRDFKDLNKTSGKLRLVYECAPMAFVFEMAGGAASDGLRRVVEIEPTSLHQRCPMFLGSRDEVAVVEKFLQGKARL